MQREIKDWHKLWKEFVDDRLLAGLHLNDGYEPHFLPRFLNHLVLWRVEKHEEILNTFTSIPDSLGLYCETHFGVIFRVNNLHEVLNSPEFPQMESARLNKEILEEFSSMKLELLVRNYLHTGVPNLVWLTYLLYHCAVASKSSIHLTGVLDIFTTYDDWLLPDVVHSEFRYA